MDSNVILRCSTSLILDIDLEKNRKDNQQLQRQELEVADNGSILLSIALAYRLTRQEIFETSLQVEVNGLSHTIDQTPVNEQLQQIVHVELFETITIQINLVCGLTFAFEI